MRALISVFDKTGLVPFARGLDELGFELVASSGTAVALHADGVPVTPVEELTEFPELLEGRVKTLHPRIHAAILARRGFDDDLAQLAEHAIEPFDLVCVNLYPFEKVVGGLDVEDAEVIEMIDVGGPAMLRAAAKNFSFVTPLSRPEDYDAVLLELRALGGETTLDTRWRLAGAAFAVTASYDAAIAGWFQQNDEFPETIALAFDKALDLAYGENPHQQAAYYAERGRRTHLLSRVEQLSGMPLSFNNLNDLSAARLLAREFEDPACVIVKHANPCGVAVGETVQEAYTRALAADPVSAYGAVVVLNRTVGATLGEDLAGQFVEVLFAPGYEEQALEALARKASMRILSDTERSSARGGRARLPARARWSSRPGKRPGDRDSRRHGGRLWSRLGRAMGRSPLRLARGEARELERDRGRTKRADHRHRSGADEPRGRRSDRAREGAGAGPRARRGRPRLRCVLPVRRRTAARARRGGRGARPTGWVEA